MKRKVKWYLVMIIAVFMTGLFATVPVSAASKATKNKKAVALYEKKAKKLRYLEYKKYVDITGDGIKEAIFYYHPKNIGSGRRFVIYTYKNGKIKRILYDVNYGLMKMVVYKKSKTFIANGGGHGNTWDRYYKLSNGKYVELSREEFKSEDKKYKRGKKKVLKF